MILQPLKYTNAIFVIIFGLFLAACQAIPQNQTDEAQLTYTGKKIVWVDSYNQGNPWSDGIERGIESVLKDTGVELQIIRLDTAQNTSEEYMKQAALVAKAEIETFHPDALIATDDNAQKYLVVPFFKETDMPIVFAGVNWDASAYGYPAQNITGMIEVDLVGPLIRALRVYAEGDRVAYLSGDTETQHKVTENYNKRFFDGKMEVRLVKTFEEFKQAFVLMQDNTDMLITGNYTGIENWDEAAAKAFIMENTKIPTGYVDGYMTPLVLITMGKIPEEQGEYAANVALKILDGASPSDFPIATNKQAILGINLELAQKLDIVFAPSMLKNAKIIYKENEIKE